MHATPPVEVELGNGRRERAVMALIWAMAGALWSGWLFGFESWSIAHGATLPMVIAAAVAGAAIASPMHGHLAWDGNAWWWRADRGEPMLAAPGLRLVIDLGGWVLLRDDVGRWCGLGRRGLAADWHGLQLALHAASSPRPTA